MTLQALTPEEVREQKVYIDWGLTDDEYDRIQSLLGRLPNYTECGVYSVMWSEHCSYKNSKPVLKKFYTEGEHVLQGPGEGAGIVDIGDEQAVVFKMESHNHPSYVEPYEGAATGVGGIIRDIFSMGARPIVSLNSLRFGELNTPRTLFTLEGVVAGIGGYGNCIGIPTVAGETKFDSCYSGNPLVNAMTVGLIDHKHIQQGRASGIGNSIMYVGAKTGRDGIHGATFASEEFSDASESQRSAVQVGDPFMEKLLMEACLDLIHHHGDLLVGIQDMGAAGLVSSSSEMASKSEAGLVLNLDHVPQREAKMTPYEILLSESQERMLICVKAGREQEVADLFSRYDLDAVTIGSVTDDRRYRVYQADELVCDIPVDSLAEDAPVYQNEQVRPERMDRFAEEKAFMPAITDVEETLIELLKTVDLADKSPIYETYDSMVRTCTVVGPGSDAAVVRMRGTKKALAMTVDCNSRYIYLDPYQGGQIAVAEAARNIVASGAKPLAITDCLNFGNPEKPEIFYELTQSARGISEACELFQTPVISGNVSLYNESNGQAIYPTPTIGMVGLLEDIDNLLLQRVQQSGDTIYLIGETRDDYAGSLIQKTQQGTISGVINFDLELEHAHQQFIFQANQDGLLQSAHDLSEGGLLPGLLQVVFKTDFGLTVNLSDYSGAQLFSETQSRYIVSVAPNQQAAFEAFAQERGVFVQQLGTVTNEPTIHVTTTERTHILNKANLESLWQHALPTLLNPS